MLKRRIIIGLISIFLILICYAIIPKIVFASPDNTTIYVSADAMIWDSSPDNNYGGLTTLTVQTQIDSNFRTFLKFNLNELPESATITLAILIMECYGVSNLVAGITDVQAHRVADDSWIETGDGSITWNNQKTYGVVEDTVVPAVGEVEWNVTDFVIAEFDGDKIVSLCLKAVTEDHDIITRSSSYWSREYNGSDGELYIEYSVISDNEPFYSNAGYDNITQVGESADFWVFWEDDFNLETCWFSTNNNGTWANISISVSGLSSWANISLQLNFTANMRVDWKWFCMDNASQWSDTSPYFLTTTPLYITFNFNNSTMGKFKVDNINTANETQNSYNYNQDILLDGITLSSDYVWNNFTWSDGNSIINNYNYTTSGNNTIWCYFGLSGVSGIDESYFVLGFVIAGCAILFIVIVLKSDKKEK